MKQLIIIATGLILVSCGSPYTYRSGKIRKFKVDKPANKEERSLDSRSERKKHGRDYVLAENGALIKEYEVSTSSGNEMIEAQQKLVNITSDEMIEEENAFKRQTVSVEDEIWVEDERDLQEKSTSRGVRSESSERKPTSKKRKHTRRWVQIDWEEVGYWALGAAILIVVILGLIYAPVATLAVISVLLAIGIIVICGAIVMFFVELFDAFLSFST